MEENASGKNFATESGTQMKCPACGAVHNAGDNFCVVCGARLHAGNQAFIPVPNVPWYYAGPDPIISENDLTAFIWDSADFYNKKFRIMMLTNSNVSWNWAAFLFGGCWLVYRKMYGVCALYHLIGFIVRLIFQSGILAGIASLVLWICFGIFGNAIYKRYVESHIIQAKNLDETSKKNYYIKKGGTKDSAVWIYIAICLVLSFIENLLKNVLLYV